MAMIIGQRWQVYEFNQVRDGRPANGEKICVNGTPDYGTQVIDLIGDGTNTVAQLYAQYRERLSTVGNATLTDAAGTDVLKAAGTDTVAAWLQSFRNNIRSLLSKTVAGLNIINSPTAIQVKNALALTRSDVGLGNVTNHAQVRRDEMSVANGVATLDAGGKVPLSQLPDFDNGGSVGTFTEYTFIIDSNATLAAWANDTPGNDYSRILIKAGKWTLNTMFVGGIHNIIDIANGRTSVIVGEVGSKIVINNSHVGTTNTTLRGIVGSLNNVMFVENVELEIILNATIATSITMGCIGFMNCSNLINCKSTVGFSALTSAPDSNNNIVAFHTCNQLTNCTGVSTGYSSNGTVSVYHACNELVNCSGTVNATSSTGGGGGPAGTASGVFRNCNQLINCSGIGINASTTATVATIGAFHICNQLTNCIGIGTSRVFNTCNQLTNCTGTLEAANNDGVFRDCNDLTNCRGTYICSTATGTVTVGTFHSCNQLTNCEGRCTVTGSNTITAAGFHLCRNLTGCRGTGRHNGTGSGFGFNQCRTGFACRRIPNIGSGPSLITGVCTTQVFNNCLMVQATTNPATNDWANTSAGGWNDATN